MNTISGMEQTTPTPSNWQKVKNFFASFASFAPFVLPIFLAAEPTTKTGFYLVTAMSAILPLFNIINLIIFPFLNDNDKYKKILKKFFWPIVAIVGAFALFLILHLIDAFTKFKIMELLFAKWREGGTGASIANFFIGLLRVPFGLLYFTSGGFIGRALYNKKTIGTIINPQVTV